MVYNFFDKKTTGGGVTTLANKSAIKSIPQNEQLAEDLHKPHNWGADLADMQLISKFNKEFRFVICVIDIYIKCAWVVSLKDKKGVSIVNAFQKIKKKSTGKPHKIWIDRGSEFYNFHFKKWLKKIT